MSLIRFFRNSASASRPRPTATKTAGVVLLTLLAVGTGLTQPAATQPTSTSYSSASDEKILSAIPADALAIYYCQPPTTDKSFGSGLAGVLGAASALGVFGQEQQILADAVSVVLELSKHPHAIVLTDIASKRLGEGSFGLDHFSAGVIVDVPPTYVNMLSLLKQIIDHYYTLENAQIVWIGEGATQRQRLTVSGPPDWAFWEWGWAGDLFVFAVGPGAYDRIAERIIQQTPTSVPVRSLAAEQIVRTANAKDAELNHRLWLGYFSIERIAKKLAHVLGQHFDRAVATLKLDGVNEVVFSAGYRGRAFISRLYLGRPKRLDTRTLTWAIEENDPRAPLIPAAARTYAHGLADISATVEWAVGSYLSTRNPKREAELTENYSRVLTESGLSDTYRDLFDHLGPTFIVHDWPIHPFNWPTAKTLLIQYDGSEAVQNNLPRILAVWRKLLIMKDSPQATTKGSDENTTWTKDLFSLRLDRTDDKIWFLHIGPLVLVAGGRSDSYLVFSWSVRAVQENLALLKQLGQ